MSVGVRSAASVPKIRISSASTHERVGTPQGNSHQGQTCCQYSLKRAVRQVKAGRASLIA